MVDTYSPSEYMRRADKPWTKLTIKDKVCLVALLPMAVVPCTWRCNSKECCLYVTPPLLLAATNQGRAERIQGDRDGGARRLAAHDALP